VGSTNPVPVRGVVGHRHSPLLWGTGRHLAELFGDAVTDVRSVERTCTWRYPSAEELVAFFRRWYGPTLKAF
jgi:hypothetical protein